MACRREALQMPNRRLWQVLHHLQHPQGSHPDTHRRAAVLLLRAQLRPLLCQRYQLQEPHADTHRSVPVMLRTHTKGFQGPGPSLTSDPLLQVRSRMCALCLAVKSASPSTPACTSTTWYTHHASRTTATTAARPTSRSPRWPCTNARPTTIQSPSRRSRRPTSSPLKVSADRTTRTIDGLFGGLGC